MPFVMHNVYKAGCAVCVLYVHSPNVNIQRQQQIYIGIVRKVHIILKNIYIKVSLIFSVRSKPNL